MDFAAFAFWPLELKIPGWGYVGQRLTKRLFFFGLGVPSRVQSTRMGTGLLKKKRWAA